MVSVPCTGFSKRAGVTNRDSMGPETVRVSLSATTEEKITEQWIFNKKFMYIFIRMLTSVHKFHRKGRIVHTLKTNFNDLKLSPCSKC